MAVGAQFEHELPTLQSGDVVYLDASGGASGGEILALRAFAEPAHELTLCVLSAEQAALDSVGGFFDRCCFQVLLPSAERGAPITYGSVVSLRSVSTGLYISAFSARGARSRELGTTAATLGAGPRRDLPSHLLFRLSAQYRVRAEGERVYVSDRLTLTSVQSLQHLHASVAEPAAAAALSSPPPPAAGAREANFSLRTTGWRVLRFAAQLPAALAGVRAGDVVMLYHRQAEGFVRVKATSDVRAVGAEAAARGARAHEDAGGRREGGEGQALFGENSVMLRSSAKAPKTKPSWKALWEVELAGATDGGAVLWHSTRVRFRHLLTGAYLALPPPPQLQLPPQQQPPQQRQPQRPHQPAPPGTLPARDGAREGGAEGISSHASARGAVALSLIHI